LTNLVSTLLIELSKNDITQENTKNLLSSIKDNEHVKKLIFEVSNYFVKNSYFHLHSSNKNNDYFHIVNNKKFIDIIIILYYNYNIIRLYVEITLIISIHLKNI